MMVRITIKPQASVLNERNDGELERTRKRTREGSLKASPEDLQTMPGEKEGIHENDKISGGEHANRIEQRAKRRRVPTEKAIRQDEQTSSRVKSEESEDVVGVQTRSNYTRLKLKFSTTCQNHAREKVKAKNFTSTTTGPPTPKKLITKVRFKQAVEKKSNTHHEKANPTRTKATTTKVTALEFDTQACVICENGRWEDANKIVFCDGCNKPYHRLCHIPHVAAEAIDAVEVDWFCGHCMKERQEQLIEEIEKARDPDAPVWSGMSGEKLSPETKRYYLEMLPQPKLIELLLYCEKLHPDLPIYPHKTEKIVASIQAAKEEKKKEGKERKELPPSWSRTPTRTVSHWWHPKYGEADPYQPGVKMSTVPGRKYCVATGKPVP